MAKVDVLVVGGGPAGLTAALTLARQLHTVIVLDSGDYRNAEAYHMHTVLTWDHKNPGDFLRAAKDNILTGYQTVQFESSTVVKVIKTEAGLFNATDEHGKSWTGSKLILCTGVTDLYPNIEGYGDYWVKGM